MFPRMNIWLISHKLERKKTEGCVSKCASCTQGGREEDRYCSATFETLYCFVLPRWLFSFACYSATDSAFCLEMSVYFKEKSRVLSL